MPLWVIQNEKKDVGDKIKIGKAKYEVEEVAFRPFNNSYKSIDETINRYWLRLYPIFKPKKDRFQMLEIS